MKIVNRARRGLAAAGAGALVLALTPAGSALADTQNVCDAAPVEASFDDVDQDDLFADEILCVAGYTIVQGYPDGTFRPLRDVTRGQASKFVVNFVETALGQALPLPEDNPFEDVGEDSTFRNEILKLYEAGIIDGVSQTRFEPQGNLTRGQMSKIVVLGIEYLDLTMDASDAGFRDVPQDGTFKSFIDKLANEEIVGGYPDGTFRPNTNVSRRQLAKFVVNGAGFADDHNEWEPTRLIGPVLEADANTAFTGDAIEVVVTVYDEAGAVVEDQAVDAFVVNGAQNFEEDGSPNYASGATVNGGNNGTGAPLVGQGRIDGGDPTTDENGQLTLTVSSSDAGEFDLIAWIGESGEEFDNEDVPADRRGSTPVIFRDPPSQVGTQTDRATATYPYGDDPSVTVTLHDDDDNAVRVAGARLKWEVQRSNNVVATGTADSDEAGQAVITYSAPSDPNPSANNDTEDQLTVFWDENENGTQDSGEDVEGSQTLIFDDEPTDTVGRATLAHSGGSNNPYSTRIDSNLHGQSHSVTVTVINIYGDPIAGNDVTFTVTGVNPTGEGGAVRSTNSAGVATFSYTGDATSGGSPATGDDSITAEVTDSPNSNQDDDVETTPADLTKWWVTNANANGHDTANGPLGEAIVGVSVSDAYADTPDSTRRYRWDSDDQFFINQSSVSRSQFEARIAEATSNDRLMVDYQTGSSTFRLLTPSP